MLKIHDMILQTTHTFLESCGFVEVEDSKGKRTYVDLGPGNGEVNLIQDSKVYRYHRLCAKLKLREPK